MHRKYAAYTLVHILCIALQWRQSQHVAHLFNHCEEGWLGVWVQLATKPWSCSYNQWLPILPPGSEFSAVHSFTAWLPDMWGCLMIAPSIFCMAGMSKIKRCSNAVCKDKVWSKACFGTRIWGAYLVIGRGNASVRIYSSKFCIFCMHTSTYLVLIFQEGGDWI